MSKQSRFWCWTSFEVNPPDWDMDYMCYMIYQKELCPDTQRIHWQGYVEFTKKIGLAAVKSHLGNKIHAEIRKGSQEEAIDYCTKEDTRIEPPVTFGVPSGGQGTRTDINNAIEAIKNGANIDNLYENFPNIMIKYGSGMQNYINFFYKKHAKSWRVIDTTIITGPPGVGKTKSVYENHPIEHIYKLTDSSQSLWFDGYAGEPVLLIDDFDNWISYKFLLNLLDGYPLRLPIKGSHTYAQWTKVYITSNTSPALWWNGARDEIDALKRRVNLLKRFVKTPLPEVEGNTGTSTSIHFKKIEVIKI